MKFFTEISFKTIVVNSYNMVAVKLNSIRPFRCHAMWPKG